MGLPRCGRKPEAFNFFTCFKISVPSQNLTPEKVFAKYLQAMFPANRDVPRAARYIIISVCSSAYVTTLIFTKYKFSESE